MRLKTNSSEFAFSPRKIFIFTNLEPGCFALGDILTMANSAFGKLLRISGPIEQ